jgi:hypothetical protein
MATPPPPRHTYAPGWDNASAATKVAACNIAPSTISNPQGGTDTRIHGPEVWIISSEGELWYDPQLKVDSAWSGWTRYTDPGYQVLDVAAVLHNNALRQLWYLDLDGAIWSVAGGKPGHAFWGGPEPNAKSPSGLQRLAASRQGGTRGAGLWAITQFSSLIYTFQPDPPVSGKDRYTVWDTNWEPWPATPENSKFAEIAAAQQNGGLVQFWAIDTNNQLWSRSQISVGGDWGPWSPPNWDGAPPLIKIAASEMGGSRGQVVWGITKDNSLVCNFQLGVGTGWSGWSSGRWWNAPPVQDVAACMNNNSCVQLWAITLDEQLISVSQLAADQGWGPWSPPLG